MYDTTMTLRTLLAAVAFVAAPAALAAGAPPTQSSSDSVSTASPTPRGTTVNRRDRVRPGQPLGPRVIEAPGAAVMMIPASFDTMQNGPFSPF